MPPKRKKKPTPLGLTANPLLQGAAKPRGLITVLPESQILEQAKPTDADIAEFRKQLLADNALLAQVLAAQ